MDFTLKGDSAMYGIIVAFPFAEPKFINGFQAGVWWGEMCSGKEVLEGDIAEELKESVKAMAKEKGYSCKFKKSKIDGKVFIRMKNVERHDPKDVKEFVINGIEKLDGANDE
jgi:hypothetical protein